MQKTTVKIAATNEKAARIEGAQLLGVEPDEVTVAQVDAAEYAVSLKDAPGQLDIVIREDKMAAMIRTITPTPGNGNPITVEQIEQALADRGIVFGIDRGAIENIVSLVADSGTPRNNILVAAGELAKAGKDERIKMEIGQDAANEDPQCRCIVKPGQIVAIRVPATKGTPGQNIFGEKVPAEDGSEIEFSPGDNVAVGDDKGTFIATAYGEAQSNLTGVSVKKLVQISTDKMRVEMSIFPTLADNGKLTFKDVAEVLGQEGIVHGIKEDVIREALEADQPVRNLRVAEATPAKAGVDARIEFNFRLNGDDPEAVDAARQDGKLEATAVIKEIVSAGDVLARKFPPEEPVEGSTVTGDVLTSVKAKDKALIAGKNVTTLDDGMTYVVAEGVVGYADYVDGELSVEDPLGVSEDKLCVYLSVHPPSLSGKMLTMELFENMLADRGIVHGIDQKAFEEALSRASSENTPVGDVLVAEGAASEKGEDARIEFKFQPEKSAGTIIDASGQLNYKERGSIQNVKAGDVLAAKVPLAPGKDGIDIFGDVILAEPGIDRELIPGDNVAVSDDGLVFTAKIDGMVALSQDGKISVFRQYEVFGDVDYSTGNLRMDGSLSVRGWIRSGFDVRASGEIRVGGGVEDASVTAGANLYVQGGIVSSGKGRIHAGGDLEARFLENARVHADGNIFVRDDIVRSSVSANGVINLTEGKGRIRGGTVEAVKGIEVNEIGSNAGVKTYVSVGKVLKIRRQLADARKRLEDLKRKRTKIDMILARYSKREKSKPISREKVPKLRKLVKLRRELALEEMRQAKHTKKLAQKLSETDDEPVSVEVKKSVYSGTTVVVKGYDYKVKEDIRGKVTFVLSTEKNVVELVR